MTIIKKNQMFGLESIDHQVNDYFPRVLIGIINEYKNGNLSDKKFEDTFNELVKQRFNLNVNLRVHESVKKNVYVILPDIDSLNTLEQPIVTFNKLVASRKDARLVRQIAKGDLSSSGFLDYKKVKANGVFSELLSQIVITTQVLNEKPSPQVAAVLIHEIGHIWTKFEYMGTTTMRNLIIQDSIKRFMGVKNDKELKEFVIDVENEYGLEPTEPTQKDAVVIFLGKLNNKFTHEQGYVKYDKNTCEALADQFVSRFGLAKDLVEIISTERLMIKQSLQAAMGSMAYTTIFIKAWMEIFSPSPKSIFTKFFGNTIMALSTKIGFFGAYFLTVLPVLMALQNLFNFTDEKATAAAGMGTYDELNSSIRRFVNDLMTLVKDPDFLGKEVLVKTIKDIEFLQKELINENKTLKPLFHYIWKFFSYEYSKQYDIMEEQRAAEDLLNNPLYLQAVKLKLGIR